MGAARGLSLVVVVLALSGCAVTDADGDGHLSYEDGGDDCDDAAPTVFIGADEVCDGIDNDCNGEIDEANEVPYDGIDNDCDGADADDLDGDGYPGAEAGGPDCDDTDPATHPGWQVPDPDNLLDEPLTTDVIDGIDNDCDGEIDEGPFTVDFTTDLAPLFLGSCSANQCHASPAGQKGLSLSDAPYTNLVGVPSTQSALVRVAPFDPAGSYVWHKVHGTHLTVGGEGESMPFDQPLLPEPVRRQITIWILEGAVP